MAPGFPPLSLRTRQVFRDQQHFGEICANQILSETEPVGGAEHVVEIDESKFGKKENTKEAFFTSIYIVLWYEPTPE